MKTLCSMLLLLFATMPAVGQVLAPQVPMTGNIGPGGTFPLFNNGTISMTSDADYTMSTTGHEMTAVSLKVTSTATLTATRNIIHPSVTLGFIVSIENATTGGRSIVFKGPTGTGVTIANGQTAMVMSDGTNYVSIGSQVWPTGSAGIPNYGGTSAWGTTYNASNQIPFNFLSTTVPLAGSCSAGPPQTYQTASTNTGPTCAQVQYSQVGGTAPIWNQNTTGNAATATTLSSSGTANQLWGMDSTGSTQGWQSAGGGPVYTQTLSNVAMSSTVGPLPLSCGTTCTTVSPATDTSYRTAITITQVAPGGTTTACTTSGGIQLWLSYTDADSGTAIANSAQSAWNLGTNNGASTMNMGNGANGTVNMFNIFPSTIRVKGGTSLTFRIQQSVATVACVPQPTFTLRFALY